MRRRYAVRKRDIHREEQRRLKGAKPYMVLEGDTFDDKGNIVPVGTVVEKPKAKKKPAPKKKAEAKKKPAAKKKVD